jgi:hypothetical protein
MWCGSIGSQAPAGAEECGPWCEPWGSRLSLSSLPPPPRAGEGEGRGRGLRPCPRADALGYIISALWASLRARLWCHLRVAQTTRFLRGVRFAFSPGRGGRVWPTAAAVGWGIAPLLLTPPPRAGEGEGRGRGRPGIPGLTPWARILRPSGPGCRRDSGAVREWRTHRVGRYVCGPEFSWRRSPGRGGRMWPMV